jgi:Mrp family chromosome partitioning ATPase
VVLVCADLAASAVPALFHVSADRGLAEVLAGSATVGEAMQRPADYPRLRILPPGKDPSVLVNDFQHDVTQRLISELRRSTPVVIIEVPPASEDGDAFAMAEFADAALVVVEVGKTRWPEAEDCIKRLDRLRTMVLGAVLIAPASAPARAAVRLAEAGGRQVAGTRGEPVAPAVPGGPSADRPAGKQPGGLSWAWEESADKGARG